MKRTAPSAAAVLPHEADAVLLEDVRAPDAQTTLARATVQGPVPFTGDDGAWPAALVVELMAQTVAAGVGLREFEPGVRPRLGLLLGVRDFHCTHATLAPGTTLELEAIESTRDERGMGVFDCSARAAGRGLATATLSVYLPPDVDEYLGSIEP